MANIMIVAVFDSAESLTHDNCGFTFLQIFALFDDVEQLPTFAESTLSCRLTQWPGNRCDRFPMSRTVGWYWDDPKWVRQKRRFQTYKILENIDFIEEVFMIFDFLLLDGFDGNLITFDLNHKYLFPFVWLGRQCRNLHFPTSSQSSTSPWCCHSTR